MNCATCKVNKIGPKTIPYGGFLCANEHLQCNDCNRLSQGQCGICEDATNFVQMNFNYCFDSLHDAQTQFAMSAIGQPPSAPPLRSQTNILPIRQLSACFSKKLFAEIETQSNLSQEQLSMRNSKESLQQNNSNNDGATNKAKENKTHEKSVKQTLAKNQQFTMHLANKKSFKKISNPMIKEQKFKNGIEQQKPIMETIFIGTTREENSTSHFGNSLHNVNAINDSQVIKADNKKHHRHINYNAPKESGLKENIFLFEEDPEDSNIIHTSEIRFMDSTDSLQNFYSNGTALGAKTSITEEMKHKYDPELTNDVKQEQEILSIKVLQNFETHNTVNSTEVVENYLRTYGPLAYYHFPGYNCQQTYCEFGWQQQHQQLQQQQQMQNMVEHKKTACVSTDCAPNLKNHDVENSADIEVTLPAKFKPQDYVVMHTMGASKPEKDNEALTDKFGRPNLDMRMQKVLETFQEDPKTQKIKEKPIELQTKGNYIKIVTAEPKPVQYLTENHIKPIETQQNQSINVPRTANTDSVVVLELLNSHRAYYNPPQQAEKPVSNLHTLAKPAPVSQEPPGSQFQTIPCSSSVLQELLMQKSRFLNNKPVPAYMLTITRTPIKCPESTCQRMIFVSDFNKHLVVDHSHLPMERLTPFQCKNFFLDPRLAHSGISKCHLLYLMRDKISDLGSSKYKDFLPLLVMTSRISLTQMCGLKQDSQQDASEHFDFFIIWVTGIVPEEFPISVSLTVWPRSGKEPSCHVVYSGDMYSIRHSQQGLDVWQSGRMLLLSSQELDLLTNGGKEMLNLQLMVH